MFTHYSFQSEEESVNYPNVFKTPHPSPYYTPASPVNPRPSEVNDRESWPPDIPKEQAG